MKIGRVYSNENFLKGIHGKESIKPDFLCFFVVNEVLNVSFMLIINNLKIFI